MIRRRETQSQKLCRKWKSQYRPREGIQMICCKLLVNAHADAPRFLVKQGTEKGHLTVAVECTQKIFSSSTTITATGSSPGITNSQPSSVDPLPGHPIQLYCAVHPVAGAGSLPNTVSISNGSSTSCLPPVQPRRSSQTLLHPLHRSRQQSASARLASPPPALHTRLCHGTIRPPAHLL